MSKRIAALLCLLCAQESAHAVEWDHDANLAGAVTAFVEAYSAGGLPQAEKIATKCQSSLAAINDDIQRLMRFEFCAGLEFAGYLTNRRDMQEKGADSSEYFAMDQIRVRLDRLSDYITNPVAHTQVLNAWGRSVAGELDKQLK